jgi:hypothetical protein
LWNQAPAQSVTFLQALNAAQQGQWTFNASGYTVQSSSGAGYSTSFHIPMGGDTAVSPQAMQETIENILENYSQVIASGIAEDLPADASVSKFVAALVTYFPTIKGYTGMFTYAEP